VRLTQFQRLSEWLDGRGRAQIAPYLLDVIVPYATLVDTALLTYELVHSPLGSEARERYHRESRDFVTGTLFTCQEPER
jgi:hypothetical protein